MISFRLRPKFELTSTLTKEDLLQLIKEKVGDSSNVSKFDFVFYQDHFRMRVKKEDQHYWSPELEVTLESYEEGSKIRGRYGPHHNVWTLFTLLYLAIIILLFFISMFGISRLGLGLSAKILWGIPVLLGFAVFLYFVGQIGQKLGTDQTLALHHFFEELVDQKIHID